MAYEQHIQDALPDVARGDSGTSGGRDKPCMSGEANDGLLNLRFIVGNDFSCHHRKTFSLEDFSDRGFGEIRALAAG